MIASAVNPFCIRGFADDDAYLIILTFHKNKG